MPTYLPITDGIETKRYLATSAYPTKPYLHVGNDVIPLTTNTTNGLQLKVKVGTQTYRLMEYGSESASATYYTSAEVSEGLSEVTALTRESTSGESYLTRESTSGEIYGTSAEHYLTSFVTLSTHVGSSSEIYRSSTQKITITSFKKSTYTATKGDPWVGERVTQSISNLYVSYISDTQHYYWTSQQRWFLSQDYARTITSGIYGTVDVTNTNYIYVVQYQTVSPNHTAWYGDPNTFNTDYWTWGHRVWATDYDEDDRPSYQNYTAYTISGKKVTTDTTYLTRESTYATEYFTCESTYGYSGISSSSSESSGWQ